MSTIEELSESSQPGQQTTDPREQSFAQTNTEGPITPGTPANPADPHRHRRYSSVHQHPPTRSIHFFDPPNPASFAVIDIQLFDDMRSHARFCEALYELWRPENRKLYGNLPEDHILMLNSHLMRMIFSDARVPPERTRVARIQLVEQCIAMAKAFWFDFNALDGYERIPLPYTEAQVYYSGNQRI